MLLMRKFKGYKFTNLTDGVREYFQWINCVPVKKNINKYHPFKLIEIKHMQKPYQIK